MDNDRHTKEFPIDTLEDILKDINKDLLNSELLKNVHDEKKAIKSIILELSRVKQYIKTITESLLLKGYI